MLGAIPVISEVFQVLLDSIGWVLARIFDLIPNYGVSIIILTLLIRLVLFPLGMKQIKSMQHMQAIQPKVKEIQKKDKNNKQKAQEEQMKLYREAGVNPLSGCLPVLAQFPILIAMYAVIRAPLLENCKTTQDTAVCGSYRGQDAYAVKNNHLPVDSELFSDVITHQNTGIVIINLQCSAVQAGTQPVINDTQRNPVKPGEPLLNDDGVLLPGDPKSQATLDCGNGGSAKVAYIGLLLIMVGTAFYQQRQMQKASPPGAASQQQQAIMKFMPLFFGFIGFNFPAGLVLYWTTSNLFQIGQQTLLLRAGHIGPDALEKRIAEQKARQAERADKPQRRGFLSGMMERAEQDRKQRQGGGTAGRSSSSKGGSGASNPSGRPRPKGSGGSRGNASRKPKGSGSSSRNPKRSGGTDRKKDPGSGGDGGAGGDGGSRA
jgi:YidC/Oxa1 family membrane protein insertase